MPNQPHNQPPPGARRERTVPTASTVLEDGALVELVYEPKTRRTSLALWRSQACELVPSIELRAGVRLVPYSPGIPLGIVSTDKPLSNARGPDIKG